MEVYELIDINKLTPSASNPRKHFPHWSVIELSNNILSVGIIEPLIVRPIKDYVKVVGKEEKFEIVCGERRYRASLLAKLEKVPCLIRDLSDDQMFDIQITENLQREDVSPLDEAEAFHSLMQRKKFSLEDLTHKFGKSDDYIFGRMRLVGLIDEGKKYLETGVLPVTAAIRISTLNDKQQKEALKRTITTVTVDNVEKKMFVGLRELSSFFENNIMMPLRHADFDVEDKNLCPAAGSCTGCAKRTGFGLFKDFADSDKCLDSACFNLKQVTHYEKRLFQVSKKVKANMFYAARTYGAERDYTALGEILSVFDYRHALPGDDPKELVYAVFVGIDRKSPSDENKKVQGGFVVITKAVQSKKDVLSPSVMARNKEEEIRKNVEEARKKIFQREIFHQFKETTFKSLPPLSAGILCADMLNQVPMLNSILLSLVDHYGFSIKVTTFVLGSGHEDVIITPDDHQNINDESDLSVSYQDCVEAVAMVKVNKLPMLLNDLVFIDSFRNEDNFKQYVNTFELDTIAAEKIAIKKSK